MPKYAYKKRTFLNEDTTMSAFVIASIEKFEYGDEGKRGVHSYPMIDISDCSNKISLDFGFWTEAGMDKSIRKARKLQQIVNDFVDALETEAEDYRKNKDNPPKKKVKKKKK